MLKIILFVFERLNASLFTYQLKQSLAIGETEDKLKEQQQDLLTAEKLAKKLEL